MNPTEQPTTTPVTNVLAPFVDKALQQLDGCSLDNEPDRHKVANKIGEAFGPLLGLLIQARAYVGSDKDPETDVEGIVAHSIDTALRGLLGEQYTPPPTMGRKHLRDLNAKFPDWDLDDLPDDVRNMLAEASASPEAEDGSAECAYGFVWRGREFIWAAPMAIMAMRREASPMPGVDLLIGRRTKNISLAKFMPVGSPVNLVRSELTQHKTNEVPKFGDGEARVAP